MKQPDSVKDIAKNPGQPLASIDPSGSFLNVAPPLDFWLVASRTVHRGASLAVWFSSQACNRPGSCFSSNSFNAAASGACCFSYAALAMRSPSGSSLRSISLRTVVVKLASSR